MKGRTAAYALVAIGLAIAVPAWADDGCELTHAPGTSKLTVRVNGIRAAKGEVAITVYPDDKRRFLAPKSKLARVRIPAVASVHACFWVQPGYYAVAIYHDANADHNFNRTLMGLPAEGFGFSNDPETKVGLPPFSAVRFKVSSEDTTIAIQTRYLR
ncbi:DUF2141 domain-containing protein [Phenylobacterium sp.]|uniref:DUF2141 domain-containing protein n=1 Tax=Phenylobacterium sp. TaxID=1871053 RepID=UPI0025E89F09|nr:DUF2141 domain-containing protein [Phenylobacterium sp.]